MRINEHSSSTTPLLQDHTWNTWLLFPSYITMYIIYLHLFPMHCLLCSKLYVMGVKICV